MKKHIYMLIYISICLQSCIRYYIVNDPYKYDHYRPSENELYGLWQSIEDSASIRLNKDGTCEVKNIPTTRGSEEFSTTKYSTLPYIVYGEANKLSSITEWNFHGYWKIESYPARENKEWFRIVMSPHPVFASDIQYYKLSKNDDYKNLKNGFYISINIRNKFENDSVHVAYLYETIGDPDMQDEYVFVPMNY